MASDAIVVSSSLAGCTKTERVFARSVLVNWAQGRNSPSSIAAPSIVQPCAAHQSRRDEVASPGAPKKNGFLSVLFCIFCQG